MINNHWHILCTFKSWNPAESILYDILFTCVQGLWTKLFKSVKQ
jgi:hypothetical protein